MEKNAGLRMLYEEDFKLIPQASSHSFTIEEVKDNFRGTWEWCEKQELLADPQPVWKVWAGVGLLVYGSLEKLEDALEVIMKDPRILQKRPLCYKHWSAIPTLLPIPESILDKNGSLEHPELILSWYQKHAGKIHWDPVHGEYTLQE